MKSYGFAVIFFVLVTPVNASVGDVKIIAELQAMYSKMMEQLQQLKTQSETLQSVKKGLNYSVKTYYEVKNFSADRIVRRIQSDFEGLTRLDDLSGLSMEQRILAVQKELRRRVGDSNTSREERNRIQQEIDLLEALKKRAELLNEINANATSNMAEASNDLGVKDSGRIAAEGISTLVQIESLRELENNEQKRASLNDQATMRGLNQQARRIIEGTKKDGW